MGDETKLASQLVRKDPKDSDPVLLGKAGS